jgi:hypothetical protein
MQFRSAVCTFCIMLLSALLVPASAHAQASITVSPAVSHVSPGSTVTVEIHVADVAGLHTAIVGVTYDRDVLRFHSSAQGSFLRSNEQGYSVFYYEKKIPVADPDSVRIDQAILGDAAVSGSGDICAITFEALKKGESPVTITTIELRDTPNNEIVAVPVHGRVIVGSSSNRSPVITSTPPSRAVLAQPFVYACTAQDEDNDELSWQMNEGPSWLVMDAGTGQLTGTPATLGSWPVEVIVRDGRGGTASQRFTLSVFRTDHAPTAPLLLTPGDGTRIENMETELTWSASADANPSDQVRYILWLSMGDFDTTYTGLRTNALALDGEVLEAGKLCTWRVAATDGVDTVHCAAPFTFRTPVPTPVEEMNAAIPGKLLLHAAYPNPVRESTTISFETRQPGVVQLSLHSSDGKQVERMHDAWYPPGTHQFTWDARVRSGARLPSGCYFMVVSTAGEHRVTRVHLLRY